MATEEFDIRKHVLVPEHIKLKEEEANKILEEFNVKKEHLPKILLSDPGIKHLNPEYGDIIKIVRKSQTQGIYVFYRVVVNG